MTNFIWIRSFIACDVLTGRTKGPEQKRIFTIPGAWGRFIEKINS